MRIVKISYEDTSPEKLTSLAGIEEAVRSQMQKHIIPLGSGKLFYLLKVHKMTEERYDKKCLN